MTGPHETELPPSEFDFSTLSDSELNARIKELDQQASEALAEDRNAGHDHSFSHFWKNNGDTVDALHTEKDKRNKATEEAPSTTTPQSSSPPTNKPWYSRLLPGGHTKKIAAQKE